MQNGECQDVRKQVLGRRTCYAAAEPLRESEPAEKKALRWMDVDDISRDSWIGWMVDSVRS